MSLTALPTPPSRDDPADFPTRADAFLGAFPTLVAEINAALTTITAAVTAAAASALTAVNAPGTSATSTTSTTIANAVTKTFAIQTGKAFAIGQTVTVASAASPANRMIGVITAHNSTTGSLSVLVNLVGGSGTFADWSIAPTAPLDLLVATVTELLTGAATDRVIVPAALFGAIDWQTLIDAATINTDCSARTMFQVTLGGHRAFATPIGMKKGATYIWIVKQNGTGGWIPSYATPTFDWGLLGEPVMPTAPNASMWLLGIVAPDGTTLAMSRIR